nr:cytochrome p450 [Quercus suber]
MEEGNPPTREKMYRVLHSKKDGTPVNVIAKENMEKMDELISQQQTPLTFTSRGSIAWNGNDVFSQVLGKERNGQIRGLGFGLTPSKFAVKKVLQENVAKHLATFFWEIIRPTELVKESDMLDVPYLCPVIRETLRLHPSGPFIVKECAEGCKVNGSLVKAKSSVLINVYVIMRDLELWTNLDEFVLERFLESSDEKISEHQIGAVHLVAEGEDSLGHQLLC